MAERNLAQVLLAAEIGDQADLEELSEAADRAFQRLSLELATLVTTVGSQALFARALHLTRLEFPFLAGIRIGSPPDTCLGGLRESIRGVEPTRASDGLVALLAVLIGLLTTFIGEDLTLRLLSAAWPETVLAHMSLERQEA
ncbi:MAG: hypothetical protein M3Z66_10530 [Chloroflexota bacterium]|nr:hypothetical protein [Chloroflexota bacterium]